MHVSVFKFCVNMSISLRTTETLANHEELENAKSSCFGIVIISVHDNCKETGFSESVILHATLLILYQLHDLASKDSKQS